MGAWTALDLFNRVRSHLGAARLRWLTIAALVLGASIWSMHFIAMLGFDPGSPVSYDVGLTLASFLLATAGTGIAFLTAARTEASPARLGAAGIAMGLAIAAMHYVGMAAMRTARSRASAIRRRSTSRTSNSAAATNSRESCFSSFRRFVMGND
jgi:NO-binding membrane sensor protein with MHYT domain